MPSKRAICLSERAAEAPSSKPPAIPRPRAGDGPCLLSGHAVGRLDPARQFLAWALRQRQHGGPASATLAHGFRLAFGLAGVEPALAAFEALYGGLAAHGRAPLAIPCLACAFVSADEWAVLELLGAVGAGDRAGCLGLATLLARPPGDVAVAADAVALAALMAGADLAIVGSPPPSAGQPRSGRLH